MKFIGLGATSHKTYRFYVGLKYNKIKKSYMVIMNYKKLRITILSLVTVAI